MLEAGSAVAERTDDVAPKMKRLGEGSGRRDEPTSAAAAMSVLWTINSNVRVGE